MEQNSELLPQEWKPSKIGEVEKFEKSKQAKKISDSTPEEIAQALRYAMLKIGIRAANFPVGVEKQILIFHVYDNFGFNTVDEIKLAFDWGIAGRLKVEMNCFENFSCSYFSSVMKAYNLLADAVKPKQEFKELPKPIEEPRSDYDYQEWLKSPFAQKLMKNGIKIPE